MIYGLGRPETHPSVLKIWLMLLRSASRSGPFFAQRKGPPKRACHCCFFVCIGCGAGCLPVSFWVTDHSSRSLASNSADVTVMHYQVIFAPPHRGIHHARNLTSDRLSFNTPFLSVACWFAIICRSSGPTCGILAEDGGVEPLPLPAPPGSNRFAHLWAASSRNEKGPRMRAF